MEDTDINHSVLVIGGMHRSGTSLTASLLQSAGIYVGDRLMNGGTDNPKGHFEDWDFVDLHRASLSAQQINREGWTTKNNFTFTGEHLARAQELIQARNIHPVWGWKDPRTTLFLNCWQELIPQAKFVFVYRSPWDVVDSLFRRGDLIFKTDPAIAIKTWITYNQTILRFCRHTSHPWILIRVEDIVAHPQSIINSINQKLDIELQSPQALYDNSLFQGRAVNLNRAALVQKYFPQAFELYLKLHQSATLIDAAKLTLIDESVQSPWFWQNWLDQPVVKVRTLRSWSKLKRLATSSTVDWSQ